LVAVPPQQQSYIKSLFGAAKSAIDFEVVTSTTNERIRFWKAWMEFIATYFPTYDEKFSTLSQPEQINVLSVSPNMCAPEAFHDENNMFVHKRSKYRYKPSPRVAN
jgi:hypothetical protein